MHTMQDIKDLGAEIERRKAAKHPYGHLQKIQRNMVHDLLRMELENKTFWERLKDEFQFKA